jgi:HAD superfamily hydrolase (TIGR01509 family)
MKTTILWDNDGILVDTEDLYYQATQEIMQTAGYPLTQEEYIQYFLLQGTGAWHLMEINPDTIPKLRQKRNERYSELLKADVPVIKGIKDTLETLSKNYTMGVVTSSRQDHFKIIHNNTDLLKYFQFIITSDQVPETKPSPAPYLKALEISGKIPDECIVIEDSERGLLAAHAAGIDCYIIPTPSTSTSNFTLAKKVLRSSHDLIQELEK